MPIQLLETSSTLRNVDNSKVILSKDVFRHVLLSLLKPLMVSIRGKMLAIKRIFSPRVRMRFFMVRLISFFQFKLRSNVVPVNLGQSGGKGYVKYKK